MNPIVQTSPLPLPISTTASLKYAQHSNNALGTTKNILVDEHHHPIRTMDEFMCEVKQLFEAPLALPNLRAMSATLQDEYREKLATIGCCMLPSGDERGTYLALDVGGTNLRVALVELCGRRQGEKEANGNVGGTMRIVKMLKFSMDNNARRLKGTAFFDWMAEKIEQCIQIEEVREAHGPGIFAMGVAWSFPIEYVFPLQYGRSACFVSSRLTIYRRQTSIRSGILLEMGKGFSASEGILGDDISKLIERSCRKRVSLTISWMTYNVLIWS
jgi:hexokinase